jgi:hypothetical protein
LFPCTCKKKKQREKRRRQNYRIKGGKSWNKERREEDKTIELREGRVGTEGVHLFVDSLMHF